MVDDELELGKTRRGTTNLDTYALDYDLNLALGTETLDKVPVRELKAAFKDRDDGFSAMDFKVTGTSTAPQTDLEHGDIDRDGSARSEDGLDASECRVSRVEAHDGDRQGSGRESGHCWECD